MIKNKMLAIFFSTTSLLGSFSLASSIQTPILSDVTPTPAAMLYDTSEYQSAWRNLFAGILDNKHDAIINNALAILREGKPDDCRIINRLAFLFENYIDSKPALLQAIADLPTAGDPEAEAQKREIMMRLALDDLDVAKADDLAISLGYIRNWTILGEVNEEGRGDFEKDWGIEKGLRPEGLTVANIKRTWFTPEPSFDGWMDLESILSPNTGMVFSNAYFRTNSERTIILELEAEGSTALYLDGLCLLLIDPGRTAGTRIKHVKVRVATGVHRITVKSRPLETWHRRSGFNWGFRIKAMDEDWIGLRGIAFTSNPAWEKEVLSFPNLQVISNIEDQKHTETGFNALIAALDTIAQGNLDLGRSQLTFLEKVMPDYPELSWLLIQTLLLQNSPAMRLQATSELSKLIANSANRQGVQLLQIQVWTQNQRLDEAFDVLKQLGDGAQPEFLALRGSIEKDKGLAVESERHLRVAAAAGNNNAKLILAELLIEQNRYSEALNYLNQVFASDSDSRREFRNFYENWVGIAPGDAIRMISKARTISPYDLPLNEAEFQAQLHLMDYLAAEVSAQKMIENHPYAEAGYRDMTELDAISGKAHSISNSVQLLLKNRPGNDWALKWMESTANNCINQPIDFSVEEEEASKLPIDRDSAAIMMMDETTYYVRDDYSFDEVTRRALRLESEEQRDSYGEITVPDGAELLWSRVHRPNGENVQASIINDPSGGSILSFRGLETGCLIEYAWKIRYTNRRLNELPCFYTFAVGFGSYNYKLDKARIIIDAPEQMRIAGLTRRYLGNYKCHHKKGRQIQTWQLGPIPRISYEPDMPSPFFLGPVVQTSNLQGKAALDNWFRGNIIPALSDDEIVDNRCHEITRGLSTKLEKAQAIFDYINRTIELNNGTIIYPAPARETLIKHWGRPIDRAVLLTVMMRKCGIDCHVALVNASVDLSGEENHPTLSYYDYPLVYIPNLTQEVIWVDPGVTNIGFGQILENNHGLEATVFLEKGVLHKTVEASNTNIRSTEYRLKLQLTTEGSTAGEGSIVWNGLDGLIRTSFDDPRLRLQDAESTAESYANGALISDLVMENLYRSDLPFMFSYKIEAPQLAKPGLVGFEIMASLFPPKTSSRYIALQNRKQPLILDRSNIERYYFEVELPNGWRIEPSRGNEQFANAYGQYQLEWSFNDGRLTIHRDVRIPKRTIPPSDYPALVELCKRMDIADSIILHLIPQ